MDKIYYVVCSNATDAPFIINGKSAQVYTNKNAIFIPPDIPFQKNEWHFKELKGMETLKRMLQIYGFKSFFLEKEEIKLADMPFEPKALNAGKNIWFKRLLSLQILTDETYDDALNAVFEDELLFLIQAGTENRKEGPAFLTQKNEKFQYIPAFTNAMELQNFMNQIKGIKINIVKCRFVKLPPYAKQFLLWINMTSSSGWILFNEDMKQLK